MSAFGLALRVHLDLLVLNFDVVGIGSALAGLEEVLKAYQECGPLGTEVLKCRVGRGRRGNMSESDENLLLAWLELEPKFRTTPRLRPGQELQAHSLTVCEFSDLPHVAGVPWKLKFNGRTKLPRTLGRSRPPTNQLGRLVHGFINVLKGRFDPNAMANFLHSRFSNGTSDA